MNSEKITSLLQPFQDTDATLAAQNDGKLSPEELAALTQSRTDNLNAAIASLTKAAADEVDPEPNIEGDPAARMAEHAARYKAEADAANTKLDLQAAQGNAALAAAQQALKDQAAASAAALAQSQADAAAQLHDAQADADGALAAKDAVIADLQGRLDAANAISEKRRLGVKVAMQGAVDGNTAMAAALTRMIGILNPLLVE